MTVEIAGELPHVQSADAVAVRARRAIRERGLGVIATTGGDAGARAIARHLPGRRFDIVLVGAGSRWLPDPTSVELIVLAGSEPYVSARTPLEPEREIEW